MKKNIIMGTSILIAIIIGYYVLKALFFIGIILGIGYIGYSYFNKKNNKIII
jgi:hypothetical protein